MGLLDDTRVTALLGAFVLSLLALVGITLFGVLRALIALFSPAYAGDPLLFALLDATAPYLVTSALVGMVSFLLLVALSVTAVRRASMPRNDRLARVARKLERYSPEARKTGLADRFEPTTEERIEALKEEYVAGEITELEYERRLQQLLDETDGSNERTRQTPNRTDREWQFER